MCLSSTMQTSEIIEVCSCKNFTNVSRQVNKGKNNIYSNSNIVSLSTKEIVEPVNMEEVEEHSGKVTNCNMFKKHGVFKKSSSFAGFRRYLSNHDNTEGIEPALTREELDKLFDSKKQEPLKSWKLKIKEYANKYKHFNNQGVDYKPRYTEICLQSQKAHVVVILSFVYLAFRLFPDSRRSHTETHTITRLLYVASVSAVAGTQFWMTFISGIALFLQVSRHTFGKVQLVLFPLYFLVNAVLTFIVIVTYTQQNPTHMWDTHQFSQGVILVTSFVTNLVIRVYLSPILMKLIKIKMSMEAEAGLGCEIGSSQPGVLSNCPHYMRLYKAFRKTHIIIAVGNMISLASTSMHLYYIATKLYSVNL